LFRADGLTRDDLASRAGLSDCGARARKSPALAGNDVIEATGLGTAMQFTANGGDGNDVLIASAGADTLREDAGDDVLLGGAGLDVLDGGPGNNIVIQDFLII
jgi:Ca2+-binding RTX toxin-like protein